MLYLYKWFTVRIIQRMQPKNRYHSINHPYKPVSGLVREQATMLLKIHGQEIAGKKRV